MKPVVLTCLLGALLPGAKTLSEEAIPKEIPKSRYVEVWESSPFNREVVKPVAAIQRSTFGKSLKLEGMIDDEASGPIAYIRNLSDDSLLIATTESDSSPYRIIHFSADTNPLNATVTITDGRQSAVVGYQEKNLSQSIASPYRDSATTEDPESRGEVAVPRTPPAILRRKLRARPKKENSPAGSENSPESSDRPEAGENGERSDNLQFVPERKRRFPPPSSQVPPEAE